MESATRKRFNKWFESNYTGDESLVKKFEGRDILMKKSASDRKAWEANQNKGKNMNFLKGMGGADKAKGLLGAIEGEGSPLKKGLGAGLSTGDPFMAAGAAMLGIAQQKAQNKRIEQAGQARATKELSKGESKKSDIQGQIASSIRQTLGSANRQRQVNL